MPRPIANMADFFIKAGDLLSTEIIESGIAPHRTFVTLFHYLSGQAWFDGEHWKFTLD